MTFRDEDTGKALLNTVLTADGLILTLSWGLFDWGLPEKVRMVLLLHLKIGSSLLAVSIVTGVLSYQYMVTLSQNEKFKDVSVMKANQVGISFLICWLSFLFAIVAFVLGIWRL